jgi:hypothetical protein
MTEVGFCEGAVLLVGFLLKKGLTAFACGKALWKFFLL